jgi:hypothetical protein
LAPIPLSFQPPNEQLALMARAAEGKPEFARAFHKLAVSYWRAHDVEAYAWCCRQAYHLNPLEKFAVFGDATVEGPADIRERARALIAHGVSNAPLIAALVTAEAKLGHGDAVRELMDYDRFLVRDRIEPPEGMSLAAFNAMLAAEINSDLQFHDHPESRAIRRAWRFERIRDEPTPAVRMLKDILQRHLTAYSDRLPAGSDHPFVKARPDKMEISGWAVVSDGESHHLSHIHPAAWVTGVYYVVQPDVSRTSERGWLRIGPPFDKRWTGETWESRLIEPVPGAFVLMPGYFWHDTQPMGVDQERICIAFEAQSTELVRRRGFEDGSPD